MTVSQSSRRCGGKDEGRFDRVNRSLYPRRRLAITSSRPCTPRRTDGATNEAQDIYNDNKPSLSLFIPFDRLLTD